MAKKYILNKMDSDPNKSKRLPQYIAALSVCLGSVAAGSVLGWTGTISDSLQKKGYNDIDVDNDVLGWIGSFATLGAMVMGFPIGIICDSIGRKWACLTAIIPFTIGWLLVIFASSEAMIYSGRFFTGLAAGAFCVAAPLYTSEIAEKEIRGALGSYFQLLLTVGILFSYTFGAIFSPKVLSIMCAFLPMVFGIVFYFQPETPVYLLKKGDKQAALKSLQKLRGATYDSERELNEIHQQLEKDSELRVSFLQAFQTVAAKKAILICFGLMFFQQLSGVNAVIFFLGTIFDSAGGSIPSEYATIGIGVVQVVATFVSTLVIDKFGRKILLIISALCMCFSGILLGIFFTLRDRNLVDSDTISNISFLPIVSLVIFITVFSIGFGPIPWMAASEIMPPEIKSTASSAAAIFNWFLAFIVTRFYNNLVETAKADVTFYMFSGISFIASFFVFIVVPETKGKSQKEVQDILNGVHNVKLNSDQVEGVENPNFRS